VRHQEQDIMPGSMYDMIIQDKIGRDNLARIVTGLLLAIESIALAVVSFGAAVPGILASGAAAATSDDAGIERVVRTMRSAGTIHARIAAAAGLADAARGNAVEQIPCVFVKRGKIPPGSPKWPGIAERMVA
jgi:hypothetical protein